MNKITLKLVIIISLIAVPMRELDVSAHEETIITSLNEEKIEHVGQMIETLAKGIQPQRKFNLSKAIYKISSKYKIFPPIIVALIDTESDFIFGKVSSTGDLSIAQINPQVWNKEFSRLEREALDIPLLVKDENYALERMGEILDILKQRYEGKQNCWYCHYHSHQKKLKMKYFKKVQFKLQMLAKFLGENNFPEIAKVSIR